MSEDSCVILSSRFLGWALINLDEDKAIIIFEVDSNKTNDALNYALDKGYSEIYLIIYDLWYPYPIDESKFDTVFSSNNVYIYNYSESVF